MKIYTPENIEKYILSVLKDPKSIDMLLKDHFLNRNTIKYEFDDISDNELLSSIKILKKYNIVPNIDEKILLEQIRNENFVSYNRVTPWEISDISIIDNLKGNTLYGVATAKFQLQNKWNFIGTGRWHKIIFDKKTLNVVWADLGNDTDFTIDNWKKDIKCFVCNDTIVYRLLYMQPNIQPNLCIIQNPCKGKLLNNLENINLDEFICKECEDTINEGYDYILDVEFAKNAQINKSVEKDFCSNGPNWEYGTYISYNGKTATELTKIYNKSNKIYFEIENNTFTPHKIRIFSIDFENEIVKNESNNINILLKDFLDFT